jgi:hypothetical protein
MHDGDQGNGVSTHAMRSVLTFVTCHKNKDALIHVVARNVLTKAWPDCSKKPAH